MPRTLTLLICVFLAFAFTSREVLSQPAFSGLPFVKTFHPVEYKAGIQNWSLAQDRRGVLYVANNFGLLEFDGVQWNNYPVRNGTKVRSVAVDGKGRVYVGTQGDFGYFFPDNRGALQYISLADSLEPQYRNFDEAWSIFIDKDKVYFCTFSRIYIYDGSSFTVAEHSSPLDLSFLVNRQLYVNLWQNGIALLQGNKITEVSGGEFFKGKGVSGMLPLGTNSLLISTFQDGIFTLSKGVVAPWNISLQNLFREANVNCILHLKNGNFAVGTQNNGLLIVDNQGKMVTQLTLGKGLENRTILSMFEDDRHNLWVGHNNGIAYIELGSPFTFIGEQSGLPGTGYAAYLDDKQLYLGTNTGLYTRHQDEDNNFKLVANTRGQVYHLGRYNQELLMGHHLGAYRIEDSGTVISGEPGAWVFLPLKKRPGKMIGGTYTGLQLFEWMDGTWKHKKRIQGFNESSRVMAEDEHGNLWVTHGYKGAYKIRLNEAGDSVERVDFYGAGKGFTSHLLINVFNVRNELLFTNERGVYKYNPSADAFVADDLFSTVLRPDAQIWYIQEDAFGNIYFAGSEYIGVLRKNAIGEYSPDLNSFNKIRGFLNDDLVSISILENNEVLFAAKDGFIHFDPLKEIPSTQLFKTLIRRVSLTSTRDSVIFAGNFIKNGMVTDQQEEQFVPRLLYKDNSIQFSYAATSFEGYAERQYQYYLENYESGWSDWTTQTQKEYTNLKEGNYVFHVRARNSQGSISTQAEYHFSVAPPWYRSILAFVVYTLSVMAVLFVGFNILDRKYQREQKLLEERQQQELNEKEIEIEKISIQSQEEITRLQNEKLEADLRHMNNELATATMHLLNKNEFITGIKNHLLQIARKAETADPKELLQITREIENNISADTDWEHFQFHFDRVHGDFTNRFKAAFPGLSPQEIKLSAYLRMNLSTKEIAQLLNISVRGVEISRYRLRKKLHLDRNQNLQDYILNF